jgi:5-methylcytosine-specific restriction enzyme A
MATKPPHLGAKPGRQDLRSPEAEGYRKLYKLSAWKRAREAQLSKQPLCELCLERGRVVPASIVNHRKPHKGDWQRFIDPANHQSACKPCHDGAIQSYERTGRMAGSDSSGLPTDPNHPWNR